MTDEQQDILGQFKSAIQVANSLLERLGKEGVNIIVSQEERKEGEARILRLKPQLTHSEDLF